MYQTNQTIRTSFTICVSPLEIFLNQPGDKKTLFRPDVRCKWTILSLQGKHFITTTFRIPDRSPLQVRLRVVENLLAIKFVPITVQTEQFANHLVSLKMSNFPGRWTKGIIRAWTILWGTRTRTLSDLTSCHTSVSRTFLLIYVTSELNNKCLWQDYAASNHLEITKNDWNEGFDPIVGVIIVHRLKQLQPGTRKISIKLGSEEHTNLLSALRSFTKFPHFKNTQSLTRHLVKELIQKCQSSASENQAASPQRIKTNYN